MARRKKQTRRGPRAFNILSAAEAFTQSEILLRGTTGGGIMSFITGQNDLAEVSSISGYSQGAFQYTTSLEGAGVISLADFLGNPSLALNVMSSNARANFVPMAIASVSTRIGFKLFKKLFAQPRREMNKLIRMSVGKGVATV